MEVDLFNSDKEVKVLPSLLGCDFLNLESTLEKLKKTDMNVLHFDVMDGHFVNYISFGESIFPLIHKFGFIEDVHLMVTNPLEHAVNFLKLGAKMISCHIEVFKNFEEVNAYVQYLWLEYPECMLGIAINPSTKDTSLLEECLHLFDYVLVMSVEPGLGGQKFNEETLDRIAKLKKIIKEDNLDTIIEVDGGINNTNGTKLIKAGARLLVSGSYLFAEDATELVERADSILGQKTHK